VAHNHTSGTRAAAIVSLFAISFLLWLGLTGSLNNQELITGVIVALVLSLLFHKQVTIFNGLRVSWLMPFYILVYLIDFVAALIVANLDLARRVLTPSLPIRPEVVEIETGLQSDLGRLLLANTITLTPGTLSVDYDDNRLSVHWVYSPPGLNRQQVTEQIVGRFERHLSRFLC
jgi:multicomponent Na+:H+ antiporter subunit E